MVCGGGNLCDRKKTEYGPDWVTEGTCYGGCINKPLQTIAKTNHHLDKTFPKSILKHILQKGWGRWKDGAELDWTLLVRGGRWISTDHGYTWV